MGKIKTKRFHIWNLFGMICSLAASGVGIGFMSSYGDQYMGRWAEFGADFYTYMYGTTQDVGKAINMVEQSIHEGIGLVLLFAGLIAFFAFASKLVTRIDPVLVQNMPAEPAVNEATEKADACEFAASDNLSEELTKLKGLLDAGAITEEEYEQMKKQTLRM